MKLHHLLLLALLSTLPIQSCTVGTVPANNAPVSVRGLFYDDTTMAVEVINLGYPINTGGPDYAPFVTANGRALYFTSLSAENAGNLYVGVKRRFYDTAWQSVELLPSPINSQLHEGSMTFSANDSVVLLVACNRYAGVGDCDLYSVVDPYSEHAKVHNLEDVNSSYWDSGPALTSDGRTMYFVSNRPGAVGGPDDADIYVCHMQADGEWSKPVNLGSPINTGARQDSPFVGPGDSVLFFSSYSGDGYGGLDIYMSVRKPDGTWGVPHNLGRPINSKWD